jgi:MFS family permease
MLILFAVIALTPEFGLVEASALAAAFYIIRNIVYAAASYPVGYLGDILGKKRILAFGYLLAALMNVGFILLRPSILSFILLFSMAGFFIATEDALEGAISGEILQKNSRSTGYGVLGTVNGMGDLVSSVIVGTLWTIFAPLYGFAYSAALSFLGALLLLAFVKGK